MTMTIASPCVVTIPTGTVLADGNPVVFTTNGALPTGVVSGATYYTRRVTDTTYHLYDTNAHAIDTGYTTGRVNSSGSQSGVHTITGGYWYSLPTSDPGGGGNYKGRYYYGAAYRVYRGMLAWEADMSNRRSLLVDLTVEINGKYIDDESGYHANHGLTGYNSITFTSKINGVFGDGFHRGVKGGGYVRADSFNTYNITSTDVPFIAEGLECNNNRTSGGAGAIGTSVVGSVVKMCIASTIGGGAIGYPTTAGQGCIFYNNIAHSSPTGFVLPAYAGNCFLYNNLAIGNTTGFVATNSSRNTIINNASYSNTTNWGTAPLAGLWNNNAGLSGEAWTSTGATRVIIGASDFNSPTIPFSSSSNFSPSGDSGAHTSSSALVDAASQEFSNMESFDIKNNQRPSYKNGSATGWDIGPYEFDWGYGLAPQQVTLAFSGMAEGSILAVYKTSDGSAIISPTTIGASGSYSTTYSYTGDIQVEVIVRKGTSGTKYLPYSAPGLITANGFSLIVNQVIDGVLNG